MVIRLLRVARAWHKKKRWRRSARTLVPQWFPDISPELVDQFCDNIGYTAPLALISMIQRICVKETPARCLEIGGGLTTRAISKYLPAGAFLLSVDESVSWQHFAHMRLSEEERLKVAFACSRGSTPIDFVRLRSVLAQFDADLVLIDGPSEGDRFSPEALAFLNGYWGKAKYIIVDDTDRPENHEMAARVARERGLAIFDFRDPIYSNHQFSIIAKDLTGVVKGDDPLLKCSTLS